MIYMEIFRALISIQDLDIEPISEELGLEAKYILDEAIKHRASYEHFIDSFNLKDEFESDSSLNYENGCLTLGIWQELYCLHRKLTTLIAELVGDSISPMVLLYYNKGPNPYIAVEMYK